MTDSNIVESPDGYNWVIEDDDDHLGLGGHEAELEPILESLVNPDYDYLCVGAHIGCHAIRMAKHVRRVYAVEANPATARKLDRNVRLNHLDNKIAIYEVPLWDNDSDMLSFIDVNDMKTGGSTRLEALNVGPYDRDEKGNYLDRSRVQARRLDGFSMGPFGLITIDVEGAEARVLRGGRKTIMRDRPNMVIELHCGHPGTDPDLREQVYEILDSMNYEYHSVELTGERLICIPAENVLPQLVPSDTVDLQENVEDDIIALRNLIEG